MEDTIISEGNRFAATFNLYHLSFFSFFFPREKDEFPVVRTMARG